MMPPSLLTRCWRHAGRVIAVELRDEQLRPRASCPLQNACGHLYLLRLGSATSQRRPEGRRPAVRWWQPSPRAASSRVACLAGQQRTRHHRKAAHSASCPNGVCSAFRHPKSLQRHECSPEGVQRVASCPQSTHRTGNCQITAYCAPRRPQGTHCTERRP
ncbi:hypothetical protein E2C01_035258 [Portunus trituberculatus]|uniref:Uncharacterized protein n=1 Tax=Portunus trituberculatus TaxID=210409 RepID=A0A5B7F999_PORTR|nr:hypothetical protein [Portunus trituberculatus]